MTEPLRSIPAAFAALHIASRLDLQTGEEFPTDIWAKMAQAGLFKIGIPEIFGGSGGGYLDLLKAGESFVKNGHNLGLALSWLYQQMIARYVVGVFGTRNQQQQYLPEAADGKITLSFAVSEPGRGARPKLLTTEALRKGKHYLLTGEKTYLTNGPIADVFIVVAVTAVDDLQKRFTAFFVPRTARGVEVGPPLDTHFLKPSPHGGIKLNSCRIGPKAVLGSEGAAWTDIVIPLGEIEDVVMMGPALGGMAAQLHFLIDAARNTNPVIDKALPENMGGLFSLLQAMRVVAYEAADHLDAHQASSAALVITFARLAVEFQATIADVRRSINVESTDEYAYLDRDMESLVHLRKGLLQIRQKKIGASLLKT